MSEDIPNIQAEEIGCRRVLLIGLLSIAGLLVLVLPRQLWVKRELASVHQLAEEARRYGGTAGVPPGGINCSEREIGVILELGNADVGDEEFASLALMRSFKDLIALDLSDTRITDKSLELLGKASDLALLNLSRTRITDEGLESIARLPKLGSLYLAGTAVTDRGMDILVKTRGSRPLGNIDLIDTKVTADGVRKLSKAFKSLVIEHPAAVHPSSNKQ